MKNTRRGFLKEDLDVLFGHCSAHILRISQGNTILPPGHKNTKSFTPQAYKSVFHRGTVVVEHRRPADFRLRRIKSSRWLTPLVGQAPPYISESSTRRNIRGEKKFYDLIPPLLEKNYLKTALSCRRRLNNIENWWAEAHPTF